MNHRYDHLDDLIRQNSSARDFFESLPTKRQETIRRHAQEIHHPKDLRRYAENLLQGGL